MAVWVVCFVCVGSWSFGVEIVICLSCWIPDFLRKVMKFFEIFLNHLYWLGNRTSRFIGLCFPERQFGYFSFFVLVLGDSESGLHSVYFIRFLSL